MRVLLPSLPPSIAVVLEQGTSGLPTPPHIASDAALNAVRICFVGIAIYYGILCFLIVVTMQLRGFVPATATHIRFRVSDAPAPSVPAPAAPASPVVHQQGGFTFHAPVTFQNTGDIAAHDIIKT